MGILEDQAERAYCFKVHGYLCKIYKIMQEWEYEAQNDRNGDKLTIDTFNKIRDIIWEENEIDEWLLEGASHDTDGDSGHQEDQGTGSTDECTEAEHRASSDGSSDLLTTDELG